MHSRNDLLGLQLSPTLAHLWHLGLARLGIVLLLILCLHPLPLLLLVLLELLIFLDLVSDFDLALIPAPPPVFRL